EVTAPDQEALTVLGQLEVEPGDEPSEGRAVVRVDAALGGEHTDGAVHRPRVDVAEAQAAREGAAGARLPRAGRSVHRDDRPQRPSTAAPSSARRAKKPGNETSAASAS